MKTKIRIVTKKIIIETTETKIMTTKITIVITTIVTTTSIKTFSFLKQQ